jgi:ribosomal protein S18 acetylase RimI-like enzyme
MKIRKAKLEDKKELIKLIKAFETADEFLLEEQHKIRMYIDVDAASKETAEKYLSNPAWTLFVAEENDKLVGCVFGEIREKRYRLYNKEGYITGWYVENAYKGKGVGKKLFTTLVNAFKEAGCTHLALDTHIDNERAVAIYEHMGFTKRLYNFYKPLQDLSIK